MKRGDTVLVDTVAIIHAYGNGCWKALSSFYGLETVEKCVEETQTGNMTRPAAQRIDEQELRRDLINVHAVTKRERAQVALLGGARLDPGEQDLWAHALSRQDAWMLCGPDRTSMRFGYDQNFRDRLTSLEMLLRVAGFRPTTRLDRHHEQAWLDSVILDLMLGKL